MKIDEFLEIIKVELPESSSFLEGSTEFRSLDEWDSLTGMSIVVLLEETYGIPIPDNVFHSFKTLDDIYNYISEKK